MARGAAQLAAAPAAAERMAHARSARPWGGSDKARRKTPAFSTRSFAGSTEGKDMAKIMMVVDSGASKTIVPSRYITKNKVYPTKADECAVSWGDAGVSLVLVKGIMEFWIDGIHIEAEAWGVEEAAMALISSTQLVDNGASVHFEAAGNYLNMTQMGGRRIDIGRDSMVTAYVSVVPGSSNVAGHPHSAARLASDRTAAVAAANDASSAAKYAAAEAAPYVAAAAAAAHAAWIASEQAGLNRRAERRRLGN
jgi:hypothetical protein